MIVGVNIKEKKRARGIWVVNSQMMLGTFLKNFSHVATSQWYFLKWQLPKYILAAAHDPPFLF